MPTDEVMTGAINGALAYQAGYDVIVRWLLASTSPLRRPLVPAERVAKEALPWRTLPLKSSTR